MACVIRKVIAYVTRKNQGIPQLLVFEHVDVDAGVQVPKGTVEPGEAVERAMRREVYEESGLTRLAALEFIGAITQTAFGDAEEWNFFAVVLDQVAPDTWIHRVEGKGEDEGIRFRYYWTPLNPEPNLAGRQGDGLPLLKKYVSELDRW